MRFLRLQSLSKGTQVRLACVGFLLLFALWFFLSLSSSLPKYFLASPKEVLAAGVDLLRAGNFLRDVGYSVFRIVSGFALAAALALPIGVLIGLSRTAAALLTPLTSFIRYLPVPALLPLCILWFGVGELERIAVVFIGVFFQLIFMIADAIRSVPREYVEVAYTLGATDRRVIADVMLPYSWPMIVDSLRISIGWAWGWVMLAELVGAREGIGHVLVKSQRFLLTDNIFFCLIVVGGLGIATDWLFRLYSRLRLRWFEVSLK